MTYRKYRAKMRTVWGTVTTLEFAAFDSRDAWKRAEHKIQRYPFWFQSVGNVWEVA